MIRPALLVLFASLAAPLAAQTRTELDVMGSRGAVLGWEAVGRLETGRGFCTATLIARDFVLTAAHCVHDVAGRPVAAANLRFRAGYQNGQAIAERGITEYRVGAGYTDTGDGQLDATMIANDVALLRLDTEIFAAEARPFTLATTPPEGSAVSVVSYGRGRAEVLSREARCALVGRFVEGILGFDCSVTFGSSGAPVFIRENGRLRILSIISGGNADVAYGPGLTAQVSALKAQFADGAARTEPGPGARVIGIGERSDSGAKFVRP
ncbi:trypsin-like serine peptidase [Primorskyibacter sp. 2E107]|uniref:trypsin-like serine peptidase n=1 Tax=Primorskyibacter sp. 2E107 TaxID=3403458 RepID=UPI003AF5C1E5